MDSVEKRFDATVAKHQSSRAVIRDETSGVSFTSAAPYRFRTDLVTPAGANYLHFGTQASAVGEPRAFDFGPLPIVSPAAQESPVLGAWRILERI